MTLQEIDSLQTDLENFNERLLDVKEKLLENKEIYPGQEMIPLEISAKNLIYSLKQKFK